MPSTQLVETYVRGDADWKPISLLQKWLNWIIHTCKLGYVLS